MTKTLTQITAGRSPDDLRAVDEERDIQGNPAVIVYRAKLSGEALSGTAAVKGF